MTHKPKETIEIKSENIFENDMLHREQEVKHFAKILNSFTQSTVLSIDSEWGTGKSVFVKLLEAQLKENGVKVAYFNAWEYDNSTDPLIPITNNVIDALGLNNDEKKELSRFINLIASTAIKGTDIALLAHGAPPLTEWLIKNVVKPFSLDLLERNKKRIETEKSFKELLTGVVEKEKPLVIFIDELDRCRPTFAIEVLERIKHLFNIDGIVFVVSTHLEQLRHSVSTIYGQEFKSLEYLDRFIDLSYSLEQPSIDDYWTMLVSQDENLKVIEKHGLYLIECFDLSLRDINKYFYRLSLVFGNKNSDDDSGLLALLVMLQYRDKSLYRGFCNLNKEAVLDVNKKFDFNILRHDYYEEITSTKTERLWHFKRSVKYYFDIFFAIEEHYIRGDPQPHIEQDISKLREDSHIRFEASLLCHTFKDNKFQQNVKTVNLFSKITALGDIKSNIDI